LITAAVTDAFGLLEIRLNPPVQDNGYVQCEASKWLTTGSGSSQLPCCSDSWCRSPRLGGEQPKQDLRGVSVLLFPKRPISFLTSQWSVMVPRHRQCVLDGCSATVNPQEPGSPHIEEAAVRTAQQMHG
jgi:hypothetical protein